jgi:hypothetical protein
MDGFNLRKSAFSDPFAVLSRGVSFAVVHATSIGAAYRFEQT